jgi:hypothetical protein
MSTKWTSRGPQTTHDPIQRDDVAEDFKRAVAALVVLGVALAAVLGVIFIAGGGM